ncbi:hypothetical protein GINT2_002197 [Glugoides intestinalis]
MERCRGIDYPYFYLCSVRSHSSEKFKAAYPKVAIKTDAENYLTNNLLSLTSSKSTQRKKKTSTDMIKKCLGFRYKINRVMNLKIQEEAEKNYL